MDAMKARVVLPARLMTAGEVLREIHAQTGVRYAYPSGALFRQIDATPFAGGAGVGEIAKLLAPRVRAIGDVLLLEQAFRHPGRARAGELEFPMLVSENPDERRREAYELGNIPSVTAVSSLLEALGDKDESVRHHALRSLDRLERDFRAYHPAGRVSLFSLLGKGREPAAEALLAAMKAAPDASANEWLWAAELLGKLGVPSEPARPELEKGLTNGYARTRETARWSLGRLAGKSDVAEPAAAAGRAVSAELVLAYAREAAPEARAELLLKLGRAGGKAAWDLLLAELGSSDPTIRRAAIRGLERSPDPRAVPALMAILTGPDAAGPGARAPDEKAPSKGVPPWESSLAAEYRNLAAMSLGRIGSSAVVEALAAYPRDAKKPISSAALALSWTESPTAEAPLLECLRVKDDDAHGQANCALRSYAYTGLARLGTAAAVDGIMATYDEYDNTARYIGHAAVRLAGRRQAAVDRCVELVREGKSRIAPHGLEECEDPRAVDALLEALPKADGDRLNFGLQALGRIGDPRAVPALIALLDHKEPWVRYEALRALRWRWYWHRPEVRAALERHPVFKAFVAPPPPLDEQPENTWVCRLWPVDFDDRRAANTTYEAGMAFDESTGLVVKTNGHGQRCDTPQLGETWLCDPAGNSWRESPAPVVPNGMCGTWGVAYDRASRRVVAMEAEGGHHGWQWERARALRASTVWVYDGARERWTPRQPLHMLGGPGLRAFAPLAALDGRGQVFLHGGNWGGNNSKELAGRSWTYDVRANTWTMLPESEESPGDRNHQAMCYLPTVEKVLIGPDKKDKRTWLFDVKTSQWADAGAKGEPPALSLPAVWDPVSRTALVFRAEGDGTTVWQYDPAANEWSRVDSPVELSPHQDSIDVCYDSRHNVFIMDGGHVNWNTDHIAVREVWTYRFKSRPAGADAPTVEPPKPAPARPEPELPEDVVVSVLADRTVELRWAKPASADVAGYHVYAATVEPGERMHHREVFKKLGPVERLTGEPVGGTAFRDARKLAASSGLFDHEIRAYFVKAVNRAGVESGPSATVLTLASSVPAVRAVERPDGSTLVTWEPSPERELRGYAVYRMDEFRTPLAVRLNPLPVAGPAFVDWPEAPRAERRRYYVVAVDALGQEGLPSTGAWSFGRP